MFRWSVVSFVLALAVFVMTVAPVCSIALRQQLYETDELDFYNPAPKLSVDNVDYYATSLRLKNSDLERIAKGREYELVRLTNCTFEDGVFARLLNATRPKVLEINECQLTAEDWERIAAPQPAKELFLTGLAVTDETVPGFESFPSLQVLSLANSSVRGRCLKSIGEKKNLVQLSLRGSEIEGQAVGQLSSSSSLRRLDIRNTKCDPTAFKGCFPSLEYLNFSACHEPGKWLQALVGLPSYTGGFMGRVDFQGTDIDLSGAPLTDADLESARGTIQARACVVLSRTLITDNGCRLLNKVFPNAHRYDLRNCRITGEGFSGPLPHTLLLDDTNLTVKGLSNLARHKEILNLYMARALPPGADRLKPFEASTDLMTVDLSGNPIYPEDLVTLAKLPKLESLDLDDVCLTPQTARLLCEFRAGQSQISLKKAKGLGPDTVRELVNVKVHILILSGSDISAEQLSWLKKRLPPTVHVAHESEEWQ